MRHQKKSGSCADHRSKVKQAPAQSNAAAMNLSALPDELKREIANKCSLASLVNLQLASKSWATACRGIGAKFRKKTIRELCDSEMPEISQFVDNNVVAKNVTGCNLFYFQIKGVPESRAVAGWSSVPPHPWTPAVINAYMLSQWRETRTAVEANMFGRLVACILRPAAGAAAAGVTVPHFATLAVSIDSWEARVFMRRAESFMKVIMCVTTPIGTETLKVVVDGSVTIEAVEKKMWASGGPELARRLFKRRSERLRDTRSFSETACNTVDMHQIAKRARHNAAA